MFDIPINAVEQDGTGIEGMHIAISLQPFFGRCKETEGEVAEAVACCMTQDVSYRVLLSASKLQVDMRQERSQCVLPDAKAVYLPLKFPREVLDASQQGVQSLVGRDGEAEVAGKCLCLDEVGREVGIQCEVERMYHAVGSHQLHRLDASLQVMCLPEVGSAVQVHHHACRKRLLRQVEGIEVDAAHIHIECRRLQFPVCKRGFYATLQAEQVVLAVHIYQRLTLLQATVCLDVVKVPRRIAEVSDVGLRTKRGMGAEHVCAATGELGVGCEHIERVLGQEVVKLEVTDAGIALVSHRVQVDVADEMSPALAFLKQRISRQFRSLTQLGVGMNGHLWEAHIGQAEVAVDAAEVHRGDVPLQVCPDAFAVHQVLHRACGADINHRRHQHIAGLQAKVIHVAVCIEVDVEGLRRIALRKVFRHVGLSQAEHILVSQGGLHVCLQLSAFLRREGVPVEVDVAAGRTVRRLQVEASCRELLCVEGYVSGEVVELETALLLEGKFL